MTTSPMSHPPGTGLYAEHRLSEGGAVRTLTYAMNVSLDGYVAAPSGGLGWSVPSDELFDYWSERVAATDLALYGRRMWEGMSSHWPRADEQPGGTPARAAYARRWREMPKVVFSSTLDEVGWNARLVATDAVEEIARLKGEGGGPMDVLGATLAGAAVRAGLVDEYVLATHPVMVGGGTPYVPALEDRQHLALTETRDFPGGVRMARYVRQR